MLLPQILLSLFLASAAALPTLATEHEKPVVNPDTTRYSLTIHEGNFACFQNLNCLKQNNPFSTSNLDQVILGNHRTGTYTIEGSSRNEDIYAVYNAQGELMRAKVIQRNILLPKQLREILVNDEFKSWTMIGNEVEILNFDKNLITFKVVLSRDGEVRVEHFDKHGQRMNRLS